MLWISAETFVSRRTLPRTASVTAARTTPGIVPRPPKMFTPPSSTIVTTVSVRPWPTSARALAKRARQDDAGEGGDGPRQDEQQQLDPGDPDAGVPRGARRSCRSRTADARATSGEGRRRGRSPAPTKTRSGHGIGVPGMVPNPKVVNQSGKPLTPCDPRTTRARPRNSASVPSVTTSDGRPNARDEDAVEQPAGRADDEHDRDRRPRSGRRREQEAEDGARQAGHRLDREVDLAGDDDQGHRQGHDRDLDHGRR